MCSIKYDFIDFVVAESIENIYLYILIIHIINIMLTFKSIAAQRRETSKFHSLKRSF